MREIRLEEAREIAWKSNVTHVRFTYADGSYHQYPIDELDYAMDVHKWSSLGLKGGVLLGEKCRIKNKGMASGWREDDFIQIGEVNYAWNTKQMMSPAWEYQKH
jgi:hypothetical protein